MINPNQKVPEKDKEKEYEQRSLVFHYWTIESLNPGTNMILNKEYMNPYDIKSGLVKNINIISVFFPFSWIYSIITIYLDKFIPCFPLDFPINIYSPLSLWPCVLEKALAKVFRSYDNLSKITYFELYQILTGFPIYHFKKIFKERESSNLSLIY